MKNRYLFGALLGLAFGCSARASYQTFLNNGPSSNRVDIVFLGDGYQATELSTYQTHVQKMINHLFNEGEDPFPRYNSYFNAHRIDLISAQSGADDPTANTSVNTALDATYLYDGVTQRLLYVNDQKADAAVTTALNGAFTPDVLLVSVNSSQYGGGGGKYAVYAGGNDSAPETALHELGHAFAGLGDEYGGYTTTYTGTEPNEPDLTKDPTGAKWSQWIGYNQPGIGVIGAYEGGGYYDEGIYRPSLNSKMRQLGNPFDAVSREEIILDIYRHVRPLDSWLDNTSILDSPVNLWVAPIDPTTITSQWLVNGSLVPGATGSSFNPLNFGYGAGTYTITAHNYDPTDWVRRNRDLLTEDINWTVTYAVPEPANLALVLLAGGLGWLLRRFSARAFGPAGPLEVTNR